MFNFRIFRTTLARLVYAGSSNPSIKTSLFNNFLKNPSPLLHAPRHKPGTVQFRNISVSPAGAVTTLSFPVHWRRLRGDPVRATGSTRRPAGEQDPSAPRLGTLIYTTGSDSGRISAEPGDGAPDQASSCRHAVIRTATAIFSRTIRMRSANAARRPRGDSLCARGRRSRGGSREFFPVHNPRRAV